MFNKRKKCCAKCQKVKTWESKSNCTLNSTTSKQSLEINVPENITNNSNIDISINIKKQTKNEQQNDDIINTDQHKQIVRLQDLTIEEFSKIFVDAQKEAYIQVENLKKEQYEAKRKERRITWYNLIGYVDYSDKKGWEKFKYILNMYIVCPIRACFVQQEQLQSEEIQPNALRDLPCFLLSILECIYYLLSLFLFGMSVVSFIKQMIWYGIVFVILGLIAFIIARDGPRLDKIKLRISNDEKYIDKAHTIATNVVTGTLTVVATIVAAILVKILFPNT